MHDIKFKINTYVELLQFDLIDSVESLTEW